MLRKVSLRNFKGFEEETFELPEHLVVVGPNNCGKTSLLQAIATWSEIANHWFETNPNFARDDDGNYLAADLNLLRFDAVPLPDFSHLWRGKRVAVPISISVETAEWQVGLEITHSATEFARVRPLLDVSEADLQRCREHRPTVVHVPPISRLAVEEQPLTESGMKAIVRRGQISDVLRNVLAFVHQDAAKWQRLQSVVREFFGYELLSPTGSGARVIALYRHREDGEAYDLSVAASGFLQVLAAYVALLLEDASVILIDEPDAHLHLLLKETAYRKLRRFAYQAKSQLIVATHSEAIIRRAETDDLRLLWRGFREVPQDKRVGNVLRLKNETLMMAETEPGILYVEGESDLDVLREWARVSGHRLYRFLDKPFCQTTEEERGKDHAGRHFRALCHMVPDVKGVELRDGDRPRASRNGLLRLRWCRKELENYLLHPSTLERFVGEERGGRAAGRARTYMRRELGFIQDPFGDTGVIVTVKGSDVLSAILQEAGLPPKKTEYWRIAAQMRPEEVHPEVLEKLDAIATHFGI